MSYEFFEAAIKACIRESGRSQAATARMLKVEPDTFNKWVRQVNRIPMDVLHDFCELVELSEQQRQELFVLAGHTVPPVVTSEPASQPSDALASPLPLPDKPYRDLVGREEVLVEILTALRDPSGKRMLAVDGMGVLEKRPSPVRL